MSLQQPDLKFFLALLQLISLRLLFTCNHYAIVNNLTVVLSYSRVIILYILLSYSVSQLIGVWVFSEWTRMGKETPLQLVEFGPGRGTLIMDVLRVSDGCAASE